MQPQSTEQQTRLDLTAATGLLRRLYGGGWRPDSVTQMGVGSTEYLLLHPTGRELSALIDRDGHVAELKLTGLTLDQAVTAVGSAEVAPAARPAEAHRNCDDTCGHCNLFPASVADPAEPDLRQQFAAELRRIADDIVAQQLPLGSYPSLRLGVVHSRADLDPWADYLSTTVDAPDSTDIPSVTAKVLLTDRRYGPELTIAVQSPKETSELERLRARNAELEAQLAEGGAAR